MVLGKLPEAFRLVGRLISTVPNLTESSALRAFRPGAAGSSTTILPGFIPGIGFGEKRRSVGQSAILGRPHQLFDIGRLEREAFVDIAFAVFDHRDAGRSGLGQGAGALRAVQPAATVLLRKVALLAARPFAAPARQKDIIDQSEHRAFVGIHREHRMKRQAQPLLVDPQRRCILKRKHMAAGNLGAGASQGRGHHLAQRHLGIVQKPRDPHLAGAVAAKLSDTDPLAAVGDKPLRKKGPPFSRRTSPNSPSTAPS